MHKSDDQKTKKIRWNSVKPGEITELSKRAFWWFVRSDQHGEPGIDASLIQALKGENIEMSRTLGTRMLP